MRDVVILIPTLDERANVERLVRQLGTDVPVVCVDSGSTDGTVEFVRTSTGWTLLEHPYSSQAEQLNWALDTVVSARWVFVLDADEQLDFPAATLYALARRAEALGRRGVAFRRKNYLGARRLRHGGWSPDWQSRLLRADVRYEVQSVHSHPVLEESELLFAEEELTHYSYRDIDHYIEKLAYYTSLEARLPPQMTSHRPRYRRLRNLAQVLPAPGLARFVYLFVVRGGFRDGWLGFYLALWTGFKISVGSGRRRLAQQPELAGAPSVARRGQVGGGTGWGA